MNLTHTALGVHACASGPVVCTCSSTTPHFRLQTQMSHMYRTLCWHHEAVHRCSGHEHLLPQHRKAHWVDTPAAPWHPCLPKGADQPNHPTRLQCCLQVLSRQGCLLPPSGQSGPASFIQHHTSGCMNTARQLEPPYSSFNRGLCQHQELQPCTHPSSGNARAHHVSMSM